MVILKRDIIKWIGFMINILSSKGTGKSRRQWKKLQSVGDFIKQSIDVLMRLCVFFKSFFFIKLGKKAKLV